LQVDKKKEKEIKQPKLRMMMFWEFSWS